jgi:hypothetical protein
MSAVHEVTVPPAGRMARLYRPTPDSTALVLYLLPGLMTFPARHSVSRAASCSRSAQRTCGCLSESIWPH